MAVFRRKIFVSLEMRLITSQLIKLSSLILSLIFILNFSLSYSQDTVKVMHYNILNYGNNTGYCNTTNNNIDDKELWLRDILNYVKPDILTVNEIAANTFIHQRLLDSSLNVNGIDFYKKAVLSNLAGSSIVNMLYYDTTKFVLHSQDVVHPVTTRDIDIYKLYFRSTDISVTHDTTFIYCIVAHLKAGNSSEDAAKRAVMTSNMMDYLSNNYPESNFMFLGDYNVYTSSETAYQNLLNYSDPAYRFYDPINRQGSWNNNSSFADVHTQSTHSSSNGCASGGGMDDRFDQILVSDWVMKCTAKVEYVNGSYKAVGQDGSHFNQSINSSPQNSSVPADVLDALYNMSDHLPVVLKLKISSGTSSLDEKSSNYRKIKFENPVNDMLHIRFSEALKSQVILEIYSSFGNMIKTKMILSGSDDVNIDLSGFSPGLYLFSLSDNTGTFDSYKIIKL